MKAPGCTNGRSGFSLLELVITVVLLAMVFGGSFALSKGTSGAYSAATDDVEVSERASLGAKAAVDALMGVAASSLGTFGVPGIPAPGTVSTSIQFRKVTGYDTATGDVLLSPMDALVFEDDPADPPNGLDDDGDGLVDEGRVVLISRIGTAQQKRLVVCSDVLRTGAGEIAGNGVDDDGDGVVDEPGFAIVWSPASVEIQLAVGAMSKSGDLLVRSATRAVTFRN